MRQHGDEITSRFYLKNVNFSDDLSYNGTNAVKIAAGYNSSAMIISGGTVYTWGFSVLI